MGAGLLGLHEVAELLRVTKRTAARYTRRADFPEPIERLAAGPIWRRRDVEAWAKKRLPLPTGRPARASARRQG
jgi:predicted DNA-binding transcriptional regulator AlpA